MNQQQQHKQTTTTTSDTPILDAMLTEVHRYTPFQSSTPIDLTIAQVIQFLCEPTRSGKRPDAATAQAFLKMCEARGLNPWEKDAYLLGYDTQSGPKFSIVTAHQAFLKRAAANPAFDGMESGVVLADDQDNLVEMQGDLIPKGYRLIGGWAKVYLKNQRIPWYRRISYAVYQGNQYSRWGTDPAGMCVKVAEADALRSSHPNQMAGMYIAEEFDRDRVQREPIAQPAATAPSDPIPPADQVKSVTFVLQEDGPPADVTPETPPETVESNEIARWREFLENKPDLETLNASLEEFRTELDEEQRKTVGMMMGVYAEANGWKFNGRKKVYVFK